MNDRDVVLRIVNTKLDKVRAAFPQIVQDATSEMVLNISQGTGRQGQSLAGEKPYTEQYAKWKAKKGRDVSKVDMTFTGHMLAAITVIETQEESNRITCVVGTTDGFAKDKIRGNLRYRDFFGFTKQMITNMKARILFALTG